MAVRRRRRGRAAFTLLEVMVSLSIVSLLFLGAVDLFVASVRTVGRVSADVSTGNDAANLMRRLIEDTREARWVALPGDPKINVSPNDFLSQIASINPAYTAANYYQNSVTGQTVDTAVLLVYPQGAPANVGDTTGIAVTSTPYDRTSDGARLLVYRSDVNGTPDPAAGQYLWAIGQEPGRANVPAPGYLIRRINSEAGSVTPAPNAVQFVRPTGSDGKTFQQGQMEIKLVVSDYSPVNGVQSSEGAGVAGAARVSTLTGKCVLLRNHEVPPLSHEPAVAVTAVRNVWAAN